MDNHDQIQQKLGEIIGWQHEHERHDDARFKEITDTMATLPKRDDLKKLFAEAFNENVKSYGAFSYKAFLGFAALIAALVTVFGGSKMLAGWLWFK